MTTLLNQAFTLTLVGMGMTFAAIVLLVAGMYVLTALAKSEDAPARRRKSAAPVVIQVPDENIGTPRRGPSPTLAVTSSTDVKPSEPAGPVDDRYLAAAAAVAVALATQAAPAASQDGRVIGISPWNTHMRGHQLTQRLRHMARRVH
jgi:Na+-transporting methylmalonyl-CoA/oxaloacetate decarboxylase gamma subunit